MAQPDFVSSHAKLNKVVLTFDDGTVASLDGKTANDWLKEVNRMVIIHQTRTRDFRLNHNISPKWKSKRTWKSVLKDQFDPNRLPG